MKLINLFGIFLYRLKQLRLATSTAALNNKAEEKLKEAILCGENFYILLTEAYGWNLTKEN